MNSLVLYAPQIIFFIIFAVIVIFSIYQSKKRKAIINDIKNYAKKNNYKLIETYNKVEPLDLFALITNPSSIIKNINLPQNQTISVINNHSILMQGYIENIIIKEEDNCTVYWGDHTYTTGSGKSKHTHHCFFIAIECNELQFPSFFVRDENAILDYLGKIFGGQDINFSDDYDFSPKFVLQGDSEGEIRKFFNSRIRKAFVSYAANSGFQIYGNNNSLLIYKEISIATLNERLEIERKIKNIFNAIYSEKVKNL